MLFLVSQETSTPATEGNLPRRPGRPQNNLAPLLRDPFHAFIAELLRRLHEVGYDDLRVAHLVVFQHLEPEGSRVTDLAAKAQMTKPSMAYLVESLEKAGYLHRVADPRDGRARLVQLTERGWKRTEDAYDLIDAMNAELSSAIGAGSMNTLHRLLTSLGRITGSWREQAICAQSLSDTVPVPSPHRHHAGDTP
ncbi:MAG: hypothetical protein NVS3B21_19530 [Acidimicrobiales bacterium]